MKKIFTLLLLSASAGYFAQTFAVFKVNDLGAITNTIVNGGGYVVNTVAGTVSHPAALIEDRILFKNTSAATHTYDVVRTVVSQTPALVLDGSSTTPNTYFCFGYNCFGSNISSPPTTNDYTILGSLGSTTASAGGHSDNNFDNGQLFAIYMAEGSVRGNYIVQYKMYNTSDPNDTLSFRVAYNYTSVGIKSIAIAPDLISEIYPNPAGNASKIFFNLGKDDELKFQVYNSLGGLVASSEKQKYTAGKNQLPVDASELSTGVYFVNISSNNGTLTKRLIITK